jgi:diguanylate cyclase (GGDEF)-like protein/PAS domain S-box-containing protein
VTPLDLTDSQRCRILDRVFDSIEDGILVLDREYNVVLANRRTQELYASRMPLVGEKCYTVLRDRIHPCPECPYEKSLATGEPHTQVMRDSSDDSPVGWFGWFEVSSHLLTNPDGEVIGGVEHIKDISERKQAEELLKDEVAWRRLLVEQSKDGIVVLDQSGKVYEANQQFARMLGYTMEEIYQLHVWDFDGLWDKASLLQQIAAVDDHGEHFETSHRRKDGALLQVEISSNGAYHSGEKLVFCVCRDVTEKKAMQEQIRQLAIRDPLTEVYNRRYVFNRLAEIAAEYTRGEANFCVSILDLDHFKAVNDTHGHQVGDVALRGFAFMVGSMIRPYDLLGRYGGEEFIIVSRNAGEAEVAAMIERIMESVRAEAFSCRGREIRLTFSCGLADSSELARGGFSIETLVSLADKRLYEAKAGGRNRYIGPLATPHLQRR